jgi:hypothetical protein
LQGLDDAEMNLILQHYYEQGGICEDCLFLAREPIPLGLLRQIDLVVAKEGLGYKDRDDFILDAIRRRLDEIKRTALV